MAKNFSLKEYQEQIKLLAINEEKKYFMIHFIIYIVLNTSLFLYDYFTSPGYFWFYYTLGAWGLGLLFHYVWAVYLLKGRLEKWEEESENILKNRSF